MAGPARADDGAQGKCGSDGDATERRFNETVRNLLNTPHKPHKNARRKTPSGVESEIEELQRSFSEARDRAAALGQALSVEEG
jgi:hypothetical protein